jgi:hypothetical protein
MDQIVGGTGNMVGRPYRITPLYLIWPSNHYFNPSRSHIITLWAESGVTSTMSIGLIRKQLREPTRSQNLGFREQPAALLTGMFASLALFWSCSAVVSGNAAGILPPPQTYILSGAIIPSAGGSEAASAELATPLANGTSEGAGIATFYTLAVGAPPKISTKGKLEPIVS